MSAKLGFNPTLVAVLIGGIAMFAVGEVVYNVAGYQKNDAGSQDAIRNLHATGILMEQLGMVAVGASILIAGLKADEANTPIRIALLIIGALIIFRGLTLNLGAGFP